MRAWAPRARGRRRSRRQPRRRALSGGPYAEARRRVTLLPADSEVRRQPAGSWPVLGVMSCQCSCHWSVLWGLLVVPAVLGACSGQRAADPAVPPPMATVEVPMPAFAASSQIAAHGEPVAPWTLTASDGSGVLLTRGAAKAVCQGPLAFTELHRYFHNPEARVREG